MVTPLRGAVRQYQLNWLLRPSNLLHRALGKSNEVIPILLGSERPQYFDKTVLRRALWGDRMHLLQAAAAAVERQVEEVL